MLYVTAVNTGLFTHFHFVSLFFYLLSEEEFDPFKSKAKVQ